MQKPPASEVFKDYKPEVLEYDKEIDGMAGFEMRTDRLDSKAAMLEKVRKAKAQAKGNKTVFRQNIRTENEG